MSDHFTQPMFPLDGLKIVTSNYLTKRVQFRFPRSKKKRIRRKWAKQAKNWRNIDNGNAYQIGDTLIVPPSVYEKIVEKLALRSEVLAVESLGVPPMNTATAGDVTFASIKAAMDEMRQYEPVRRAKLWAWDMPISAPVWEDKTEQPICTKYP